MSAIFKIRVPGHGPGHNIEITREGKMFYIDHDIEYDISMVEFGEPPSVFMHLLEDWNYDSIGFADKELLISGIRMRRLSFDWACHVMWAYKKFFPNDDTLELAAKELSLYFSHKSKGKSSSYSRNESLNASAKLSIKAHLNARNLRSAYSPGPYVGVEPILPPHAAAFAAEAMTSVASNFASLSTVSRYACSAAAIGEVIVSEPGSFRTPGLDEARRHELAWQIRRLVDVGEAWNNGRRWPPLEATE